jgi:integrase
MRLGNITRHGKSSWGIKVELPRDPVSGERRRHLETMRGTREQAKARLVEISNELRKGARIEPSAVTVGAYATAWLEQPRGLQGKTLERYRQLVEQQIVPHLGAKGLQALTTADVRDWHGTLLASGGKGGRPLSSQTVRHCHRLLHSILDHAVEGKRVAANVAAIKRLPKVAKAQIEIIPRERIGETLEKLRGHRLFTLAVTALGSGLRRGELLALRWRKVDLEGASRDVVESLEEVNAEIEADRLRFKPPKSDAGVRTVSLPASVVDVLRTHRREQLEQRLALGLGKLPEDALVFSDIEGNPLSPDKVSRDWARVVVSRKLPPVSFHGLRHTHVSALIAAGQNVYAVSKRIGHSDPALTLRTYSHLFSRKDDTAAAAIEAALRS